MVMIFRDLFLIIIREGEFVYWFMFIVEVLFRFWEMGLGMSIRYNFVIFFFL